MWCQWHFHFGDFLFLLGLEKKVAEEQSISTTSKGEEEGILEWLGNEGERVGEEEFWAGREAVHLAEWESNA